MKGFIEIPHNLVNAGHHNIYSGNRGRFSRFNSRRRRDDCRSCSFVFRFFTQSAVAINKVGDIGAFISATAEYWKSRKIDWKMAIPLVIITIISSIIGAQIMVTLETKSLEIFIAITILIFLPFFFFAKNIGIKKRHSSKAKKIIGLILFSLLAVQGAIVGAGGCNSRIAPNDVFFWLPNHSGLCHECS